MRVPARVLVLACATGVLAGLPIATARAQSVSPEISIGVAAPIGRFGLHRSAGPLVAGALILGSPARRVRYRLEAEGFWLPGTAQSSPPSGVRGDVRVLGGLATVLVGPRGTGPALYGLLGLGIQRVSVEDDRNPYGNVGGVRVGLGLRLRVGGLRLRGEVAAHAILSDHATGQDFSAATYVPVTVRLVW